MMRQATIGLLLLTLSACGGGSTSGGNQNGAPPAPTTQGSTDIGATAATTTLGSWLAEGTAHIDRDGDGIEDHADTWPDDPPTQADPASSRSLSIVSAWTDIGGNTASDTAVDGYPLYLEVNGLPTNNSQALWAVFQTNDGFRAAKASVTADATLAVEPIPDALAVHIVAGASRGKTYPLYSLRDGQPVLFATESPLMAGSDVTLTGRNLGAIDRVVLGNDELEVQSAAPNSITVSVPREISGNRLVAYAQYGYSNVVDLDLQQQVEIRLGSNMQLAQQESLRTRLAGEWVSVSYTNTPTVNLPAWWPIVLSFDIMSGDEVRSYDELRAVVWPGDAVVEVTERSSLAGRMVRMRHLLPGLEADNWAEIRAAVESVFSAQPAQDYFAVLGEHIAGRSGPPGELQVKAVIDAYLDGVSQSVASPSTISKTAIAAAPDTGFGPLDAVIGTTLTYLSDPPAPADAPSVAAGYAFKPFTFGSEYSQVVILRHGDADPFSTKFISFGGCDLSARNETDWLALRNASADPWRRVWPSDLCLQVEGLPFVSAAVVVPGNKPAGPIFEAAARGGNPREMRRRHSKAKFEDYAHQWGKGVYNPQGGYYLKADDGQPLCHMETCYIDLLTSGYGIGSNVVVPDAQKDVVELLRARMWIESILPWLVSLAGDPGPLGPNIKVCLRDDLLKNNGLYIALKNLGQFLDDNRHKTGNDLLLAIYDGVDQTISPWIWQYVQNQLGPAYVNCLKDYKLADDVQGVVVAKLLDKSGLSSFVDVYEALTKVGSVIFTPEKFAFRVQYRAEIEKVSPRTIDLNDVDASLTIEGDWLMDVDANAASPCGDNHWCPILIVTDQLDKAVLARNSRQFQLDASHLTSNSGACGIGCTRLSIPISELDDLQGLIAGPVRVDLAIEDSAFADYPYGQLRIPVPGNVMQLITRPKIDAVHPPLAEAGGVVSVLGSGLSRYGANAVFSLESEPAGISVVMPREGSAPASDTNVQLQVPIVGVGNYRVVMRRGEGVMPTDLPPIESATQLLIADTDLQLVIVGEQGTAKDDSLHIRLLDKSGAIVQRVGGLGLLAFDIPDSEGNYVDGVSWEDTKGANGDYLYISDRVNAISVECIESGNDDTCTFGMRSLIDGICLTSTSTPKESQAGKIGKGQDQTRIYYLAPGSFCGDAVYP